MWVWVIGTAVLVTSATALYALVFHSDGSPLGVESGNYPAIKVQHPLAGAVMPSNMPPPVLLWKTNVAAVDQWAAGFLVGRQKWLFEGIQPMWKPPEAEWRKIKQAAQGGAVELIIAGHQAGRRGQVRARSSVRFVISRETVENPLFYREVNLPFSEAVKDPSKIRWRFGGLDKGVLPPVVLENLPVCGNCHSFSRNGEYLAMDVDYANNKGSYVITRTAREMKLATSDIMTWDDFRREDGQGTLGLLSQISPDGRFVLSTVKDLSIFMAKPDLAFSQLFFPFRGILAVYDRGSKQFASLAGADDPAFVQSNPTWSPDGQWIVFARARAVEIKDLKQDRILLSGEEGERFLRQTKEFRYDLYRVPFNGGRGGKAEPLRGASLNGRSNYFPKYSPDGRWIIFCQAANYMLLQPDSELFIIPAAGGEARRLGCNLGRMNSWHSWSLDGRWLVFSSKAHSDYTQLYLTHIDTDGAASPPVWLEHMVAAGRAANIPEFVNLPVDGMVKIQERFLDDNSYVRAASEFLRAGDLDRAVEKYKMALSLNADNVTAHELLGLLLNRSGKTAEGTEHMQAAVRLSPDNAVARFVLGCSLARGGDFAQALVHLQEAVRWLPNAGAPEYGVMDQKRGFPEAVHYNLGIVYQGVNNLTNAEHHYREALRLAPDYVEAHNSLGALLLGCGRIEEAGDQFTEVIRLAPHFGQAHDGLGVVRMRQNRRAEALVCFQQAVRQDATDWQAHLNLGNFFLSENDRDKAIPELQETLRLKPSCEPAKQALARAQGQAAPDSR